MAFMGTAARWGVAGVAGGAAGSIFAPEGWGGTGAVLGAGAGVGIYGAARTKRGKRFLRGANKWMMRGFVGLEAVMIASDMAEGRGFAKSMYEGMRQGSRTGMLGGIAENVGSYAMTAMLGAAAAPLIPLIVAKEVYSLGETGREYKKSLRTLEMATPHMAEVAQGIGAQTNRQRSLRALQNTHINARMAMGNEAVMMHVPFA